MLDPYGRREVIETIRVLNKVFGITVILITHHMGEVTRADRVIVMDEGRVYMDGTPAEIFSQVEKLRSVHLDAPPTVALLYELRKEGLNVPLDALEPEDCAAVIGALIKHKA
jgi:energy-coupling factor transport system ATP-binding protein